MKICNKCNISKSLLDFFKRCDSSDGLAYRCRECVKQYRKINAEKIKEKNKLYYSTNLEKLKEQRKQYYDVNPEKRKEKNKRHYNANSEEIKKRQASWRKNNLDKMSYYAAKRNAAKLKRTPKWLTKQHFKAIEEFYILAKELQWLSEEPLQVDHIVPLQGKNVSGLHVPWNLQILSKSMNLSKGNRL